MDDRILSPPRPHDAHTPSSTSNTAAATNSVSPAPNEPPQTHPHQGSTSGSTVYKPEMNSLMLDASAELERSRRLRAGPPPSLPSRTRSPERPILPANVRKSLSPRQVDRIATGRSPLSPRSQQQQQQQAAAASSSSTVHQRALEDAVQRVQHLTQEVITLRQELTSCVLERDKCETALHAQRQERQAAEAEVIHLAQQLRRSEEQLQNTEHRSVTLTQHLNALTEELRFSSDALQKAHGALQQESHQHTTLKEEYSTVLRELHAWKAKCEDMKNEHSTTLAERDAMRGELEGLRGDVEGWQRRHAASEELWKAQTNSTAADLQRQVDELTSQLHEERSRSERLTTTLQNAQAEHARRCEAHRLEVDATRTELVTTVSRLEQQRSAGSAQLDEASREVAAAEQRCNSLLSRTETAERISDELRRERDQLFSELAQARDVNQLLAVRLKAATIDKEAHEMEVEARRLLTKQNEDMEKQLTELRRTIRSMMGQQQQLNSFVHSPSSSSLGPALRGGATPGANNAATTTVTGYASSSESRLSYGSSMISPDRTIQPR